jgi:hypothetical protein
MSDFRTTEQGPSVVRWEPPLDAGALGEVLTRLRGWQPLDCDGLLDDVAAALDDLLPDEAGVAALGRRLCDHFGRLADVAVATLADRRDAYTAGLVRSGHVLRSATAPEDRTGAVAHVRRIGWVTGELLDVLVTAGCLKGAT